MAPKGNKKGAPPTPQKPAAQPGQNVTQYAERQAEEMIVLKSMYMDDFVEQTATHSAWSKSDPSFSIRITAPSDPELGLTLGVVLTATYPKSPPLITLKDHPDLPESVLFKVQKYLETKPRELAAQGEVMMSEIVEDVRERLEDAAQRRIQGVSLPSLEEERAAHEAELAQAAQAERDEAEKKKQEESREEERALATMIEAEKDRQRTQAKEVRRKNRTAQSPDRDRDRDRGPGAHAITRLSFDEQCQATDGAGNTVTFRSITVGAKLYTGAVSTVFMASPGDEHDISLALQRAELKAEGATVVQAFKHRVQFLETEILDPLKKMSRRLSHRNILDVLDYRVDVGRVSHSDESLTWTVNILSPFAMGGTLLTHLRFGSVDLPIARVWIRDLLGALEHLHNHRISHRAIHLDNVVLNHDQGGRLFPQLTDAGYEWELHGMLRGEPAVFPSLEDGRAKFWEPPELSSTRDYTNVNFWKTDIWEFGVMAMQILLGVDLPTRYTGADDMMSRLDLSPLMREMTEKFFEPNPRDRPRPFELAASGFLAMNTPVLDNTTATSTTFASTVFSQRPRGGHSRHHHSRFEEDFVEEGRLGQGAYGQVVKARRKIDNQVCAVKKITSTAGSGDDWLRDILKEVGMLCRLTHPGVVRYHNAWLEENSSDDSDHETESSSHTVAPPVEDDGFTIEFGTDSQSQGLDYLSTGAHLSDSDEEEDDDDEDDNADEDEDEDDDEDEDEDSNVSDDSQVTVSGRPRRRRGSHVAPNTTLYISMEYCENRTLRNLINANLAQDEQELWRLFRQIVEGLHHIHTLGVTHRDLKPDNIFITTGLDKLLYVKIGDFGLATTSEVSTLKKGQGSQEFVADNTRSVGTAAYIAPEVRTGGGGKYDFKVDIYSLGIMFFEMCHSPMGGMERADALGKLRLSPPRLPPDFAKNEVKAEIILSLVQHDPKDRPFTGDLLKDRRIPNLMQSEALSSELARLADRGSPYFEEITSNIIRRMPEPVEDYSWDYTGNTPSSAQLLRQGIVEAALVSVFRRAGAVKSSRVGIYPKSEIFNGQNIVQLVDGKGIPLQLPFDLTFEHARVLARNPNTSIVGRSYCFGHNFRAIASGGGQPRTTGEVDFDIVTTDARDLALQEAECIKVLDDIIGIVPGLSHGHMCFHIGHSSLLQLIFEFCGIPKDIRHLVSQSLSRLNIRNMDWAKLRTELRAHGASSTSISELQRFDFREAPAKAITELKSIFKNTEFFGKASQTIAHLRELADYCKRFSVASKVYLAPLTTYNEAYYKGGTMFSCLYDKRSRDVLAAGGRYDGLIKRLRLPNASAERDRRAVGFSLAWENLAGMPKQKQSTGKGKKKEAEDYQGFFSAKRCDVLVASFDPAILRTTGIEILTTLRSNDISAELATNSTSMLPEKVTSDTEDSHNWVVFVKPEVLKIKTLAGGVKKDATEDEIPHSQLIPWLRSEIRERGYAASKNPARAADITSPIAAAPDRKGGFVGGLAPIPQEVRVLVAQTKSKKFNRQSVVENAQQAAAKEARGFLSGPIAAVEISTDGVLGMIAYTALTDAEGWKRVEQTVGGGERGYVREIKEMLESWRDDKDEKHAWLYNFRTSTCIYYDLRR